MKTMKWIWDSLGFNRNNSGGPAGGQTFEKFDKQILFFGDAPQQDIASSYFYLSRRLSSAPAGLKINALITGKFLRSFFQKATRRRQLND